ncbi:sugar ABC transporter permease [Cellulomonas sp. SG140]|uniref:sugar ABC transporter permease n=1 Tax=Cellulomonas sp. SG140 TaxID=2976536 RepID=UPI0021E853E2|nr:ABC transporter permease [Cellulomonas sp. SG140]
MTTTKPVPTAAPPARSDTVPGAVRRAAHLTGPVLVLTGMAVVWVVFQLLNPHFLTARNLSNLVLQIGVLGTLSIGMVMVLVLGEIDLSVGAIAGVSAGVLALTMRDAHLPGLAAIGLALLIGCLIGLIHGTVVTTFGIPSFIVTLAGLLVWQGVQLLVVGAGGEIAIRDPLVKAIASTYLAPGWGWALAAAGILVAVATLAGNRRRRRGYGLAVAPVRSTVTTVLVVAVVALGGAALLNSYFGVPWMLVILVVLLAAGTVLMRQTTFGQHVYAIGGNREAARRSGIAVRRTTVVVFVIVSGLAALAGVLEASRQFSASSALGGGTLQLNAIAAAVIGGTSLFGGRGRVYQALLGALVVGSVQNGLDLLGQPAAIKNISTGVILVIAVVVDAIGRRRRLERGAFD